MVLLRAMLFWTVVQIYWSLTTLLYAKHPLERWQVALEMHLLSGTKRR